MYCVKCGVELADSEEYCPLCLTRVYHPDIERGSEQPLFPETEETTRQTVSRAGGLFIATAVFLLAALICFITDFKISGGVSWSGYVIGALALTYVIIVLPIWFDNPEPVVFVPCDFAACALYLLYIDITVKGGWFLTFALPITGGAALITTAAVALCRYVRRGYLYIFGGAAILSGGYSVLIELLANITFGRQQGIFWSIYPLSVLGLVGIWLIIIAICPGLRKTLVKKFFV